MPERATCADCDEARVGCNGILCQTFAEVAAIDLSRHGGSVNPPLPAALDGMALENYCKRQVRG